jgi:TonB family protein
MSGAREQARNFLAYGFAISIAVHLIVLPFVHRSPTFAAEEPPPDVLHRDPIPTPPPTPRPSPTPRPTAQPPPPPREHLQTPQPRQQQLRINAPHQDAHHGGSAHEDPNAHATGVPNGARNGDATAGPVASAAAASAPSPTPTPRPTPSPLSCARPNVPATTLRALEPEMPPMAQTQGISGTVGVVVSLDAQSHVVNTRIQSSPSALLNQAALAAARGSQFRTEVKNCEPIAADYLFSVEFAAQ